MSTRAIKIATTVVICALLLLVVFWPYVLGSQPAPTADVAVRKAFAVRFLTYISVIIVLLVAAAVGSVMIMRRTLAEVRAEQVDNMKDLIESTRQAHLKKETDVET